MHYKKYEIRSPLFTQRDPQLDALRDPRLCAAVLAIFAGHKPSEAPQDRPPAKERS